MKLYIVLFFILLATLGSSQDRTVAVINQEELAELLSVQNDTTYVVNFWATWCPPCVSEMPILMEFAMRNKEKKIKMLLVSFDYTNKIEERVLPFIEDFNITEDVVVFDTPPGVEWMDYVYTNYTGSIPATVVFKGKHKTIHDGEIQSYKQLDSLFTSIYKYD